MDVEFGLSVSWLCQAVGVPRRGQDLRSGDVIDYATKLVPAAPVTATQTTRNAITY